MRPPTCLILLLLAASPLWAKPKVPIRVTLKEGMGKDYVQDSLAKNGNPISANDIGGHGDNVIYGRVFYMNVTVLSNDAAAVAKNNGKWCIKSDTALELDGDYQGTLDGDSLEVEMPQKNGKIKKVKFEIVDHKWRNLTDFVAK
jgi:hypothetical protein